MHNLGTVIRFEITRTLKKKSFWIAALAMPIIGGLVTAVIYFSNTSSKQQSAQLAKENYSLGITDQSGLIAPALLKAVHAKPIATQQAGEQAVKSGKLDAYFYYPQQISKQPVKVYGKDVGLFKNSRYQALASTLLTESTAGRVSPNVRAILQNGVSYNAVTYTSDGAIDKGLLKVVAPGVFLVLFYFMLITFGNQILTSITEEKENRVIEMILATIKPTTLLVGKLLSLMVLAFVQIVTILTPVILGYFLLKDRLSLPNFDLSAIPIDPVAVTLGAVIFVISFFMFTGILMTLGAAMPTAKEASSFFGVVMVLVFGPLYAAQLIVTDPSNHLVQFLSYFPLTSPIPLLLRNAVGNLPLPNALIAITFLAATAIIVISIGVRIFRFGALEYSRKLSLKEIIGRNN